MDNDGERVLSQGLREGASNINIQKNRMYECINDVVAAINAVHWSGDARTQFDSTLNAMQKRFVAADEVLKSYIDFLNEAADEWDRAESERSADNQSFDGGQ